LGPAYVFEVPPIGVTWLPFGPLSGIEYFEDGSTSAVTETRGYDRQYRLISQQVGPTGGSLDIDRLYDYDAAGNLNWIHDASSALWDYTHDGAGRLKTADLAISPAIELDFGYDAIGNRVSLAYDDDSSSPFTSVYDFVIGPSPDFADTAKIDDITDFEDGVDVDITHDLNGNITSIDLTTGIDSTLTYGPDNKLELIQRSDNTEYEFLDSFIGPPLRVEIGTIDTGTDDWIDLHYDDSLRLLRRIDWSNDGGTQEESRNYIYVGNHLLGFWDESDTDPHFTIIDQVGLPIASYDHDGSGLWEPIIRPFGEVAVDGSSGKDPLMRYPGQVDIGYDWGMVNGWRTYSSGIGEYLQPDPRNRKPSATFNLHDIDNKGVKHA
jgi:YD repeat-containing protein